MLSIKSRVKMEVDKKRYAQICAQAERANDLEQQVLELKKQLEDNEMSWCRSFAEVVQRLSKMSQQNETPSEALAAHDKALLDESFARVVKDYEYGEQLYRRKESK